MATIANWHGHTFEVSPKLIRGFTDLTIKGGCETTDKNSGKQKYVEHKYGEIPEISMTVSLNAQTGVTDVMAEAMEYVREATDGDADYFYLGNEKLLPAKIMLVKAEIVEITHMPGQGDKWISCDVKLTFKQGTQNDGNSGSGGGGNGANSQKPSVKDAAAKTAGEAIAETAKNLVTRGLNYAKEIIGNAKEASKEKKQGQGEIDAITQAAPKVTQIASDSAQKTQATTGRSIANAKNLAQKAKGKLSK